MPIVSSVKAAELIARKWAKYDRLPDAVVVEDPDTAGGHLGEKLEKIGNGDYDQYATVRGVKAYFREAWQVEMPVIAAGGIWDRADLLQALAEGADGVQMASRFVCTEECDASDAFKQKYLDCQPEDIGLVMSPAGLPGRALVGNVEAIRQRDLDFEVTCPSGCLEMLLQGGPGTLLHRPRPRPCPARRRRNRPGLLRHQRLEGRPHHHRPGDLRRTVRTGRRGAGGAGGQRLTRSGFEPFKVCKKGRPAGLPFPVAPERAAPYCRSAHSARFFRNRFICLWIACHFWRWVASAAEVARRLSCSSSCCWRW